MMDEKHILSTVYRLRSWCMDVVESGPYWSRAEALSIIEECDDFSRRLPDSVMSIQEYELQDGPFTWPQACEVIMEALFSGHPIFCFGGELEDRVARLCLKVDRRAPPGWHFRLRRRNKAYREVF